MSENTNENVDPLEEAFNAPDAEGHPEPEGVAEEAEAEEVTESAEVTEEAETAEEVSADAALAAERLEDLRRLQAEFTNFKNRSAKEKEQLREFVVADLVSALLPVIDDIDAARNHGDLEEGPLQRSLTSSRKASRSRGWNASEPWVKPLTRRSTKRFCSSPPLRLNPMRLLWFCATATRSKTA